MPHFDLNIYLSLDKIYFFLWVLISNLKGKNQFALTSAELRGLYSIMTYKSLDIWYLLMLVIDKSNGTINMRDGQIYFWNI